MLRETISTQRSRRESDLVFSRSLLKLGPLGKPVVLDVAGGVEIPEEYVDLFLKSVVGHSLSEHGLIDAEVAEQE